MNAVEWSMLDPAHLRALTGDLWAYLLVFVAAFLPSEFWRWTAVFLSRGLSDRDERIVWVRNVSAALLTCVVAKLLIAPTGALTAVPIAVRLSAILVGIVASLFFKRSVFIAIFVGEIVLIAGALAFGQPSGSLSR